MICLLYTLGKKYRNKKIYVWNINRTSMNMFTQIALRRIDIQGFIAMEKVYVGETYMNRPVLDIEQIKDDEDSVILVPNDIPKDKIDILSNGKAKYWSEVLEFNQELQNEKIIMYGMGGGADEMEKLLFREGLKTELYCVTERRGTTCHKGKMVIEAGQIGDYEDYSIIISVKSQKDRSEILETLSGFDGKIYVEHIMDESMLTQIDIIQNLEFAIRNNKEIYLYGSNKAFRKLIEEMLHIYGEKVHGYLSETECKERGIDSVYLLALDGTENKFIIINEVLPEKFIRTRKNIELAGFSLGKREYVGFQYYTTSDKYLMNDLRILYDPLVGVSISYPDGKPGWRIYGEEKDGIRILVLGGSTSSEVYYPETWVSKLYYKLKSHGIKTTVYNGAHMGNDIVDEILRLLRDGYILQPQIVISMSGINNTLHKESDNQFNSRALVDWVKYFSHGGNYSSGVESKESLYSFWMRNLNLLKNIANYYGAAFLGFLQPMSLTMTEMDIWEKSVFELEKHITGAQDFICSANNEDGYINLMQLFEHQDRMFMDAAHYTDEAHDIIADRVYEEVCPLIEKIEKDTEYNL